METTVTHTTPFYHHRLHCYRCALDLARCMPTVLKGWPAGSGHLQDQLRRALSSILLNIAEGNERMSPVDRRRIFAIARASAAEVSAVFDIADAYQWISPPIHLHLQSELHRVVKMLSKLINLKPSS